MTEHVCPVGALTTKDFRFKARVWFLRTAHERLPGLRHGLQRAPRLRPSLQQGLPLPPARQRGGQQVLDVRRGDAHLQGRARRARPRGDGPRRRRPSTRKALEEVKALFDGRAARSRSRIVLSRAALARGQLGAARARRACSSGRRTSSTERRPDGYEDDILIHRDKNPNTQGRAAARARREAACRRSSTTSRRARSRTSSRSAARRPVEARRAAQRPRS